MIVYLAGSNLSKVRERLYALPYRLVSFFNLTDGRFLAMHPDTEIFLDSGAFSAWNSGKAVDIDAYCDFILKHKDRISVYCNLDVINDGQKSWDNWQYMRSRGLFPLPVYHCSTPEDFLVEYMKLSDYIAIGAIAKSSARERSDSLDRIFKNHLIDPQGFPKVRLHAFGVTSLKIMYRYPWFSCDSAGWAKMSAYGQIYVPRFRGGVWVYDETTYRIFVSRLNFRTGLKGVHIDNLPPVQRRIMLRYIEEKGHRLGKTETHWEDPKTYTLKERERWFGEVREDDGKMIVEVTIEDGLSNNFKRRDEINFQYYLDLMDNWKDWPWALDMHKDSTGLLHL